MEPTPSPSDRPVDRSSQPSSITPTASAVAAPPPATRIILEQPGGLGRKIMVWLLTFGLGVSLLANLSLVGMYRSYFQPASPVEERFHSGNAKADSKVAIIKIVGSILDGEGFVKSQIDRIRQDEHVKAVVLRVDSPGGTVTASDQIYHGLKELAAEREIPLVVSMGGMAASGGYYVAMAVGDTPDSIYAEPTTWSGSIGVIIPHYDLSGLLAEWDIENDAIKSHPLKNLGSMTKEMTEQERALLQELVDASFERFKNIVKAGRPSFREDEAALDKIATGQVFTTLQAIDNGLVDREGFLADAIQRALELADLDEDQARVVKFRRPPGLSDLLGVPTAAADSSPLSSILELSTPRAYYMWSWLPPLADTQGR